MYNAMDDSGSTLRQNTRSQNRPIPAVDYDHSDTYLRTSDCSVTCLIIYYLWLVYHHKLHPTTDEVSIKFCAGLQVRVTSNIRLVPNATNRADSSMLAAVQYVAALLAYDTVHMSASMWRSCETHPCLHARQLTILQSTRLCRETGRVPVLTACNYAWRSPHLHQKSKSGTDWAVLKGM